jgi:hypothetical protein
LSEKRKIKERRELMYKETIICIVIVVSIFTADMLTQKYTEEKSMLLQENLKSVKTAILDENKEGAQEKMNIAYKNWKKAYEKMAYFIEHDELEKVETDLTVLKSYIEMNDNTMAVSTIDECSFIIEHIKDKYDFNLENIF